MHIIREEEKALGIKEDVTVVWREGHNIPGKEGLLEMIQAEEMQTRGRSDAVSTVFSDSRDQKRARIYVIPE